MGQWEGLCKTFTPAGQFVESKARFTWTCTWIDENVWHLHEHFENLYGVGEDRLRHAHHRGRPALLRPNAT